MAQDPLKILLEPLKVHLTDIERLGSLGSVSFIVCFNLVSRIGRMRIGRDFSDFTYQDRFGQMKGVLREAGMDVIVEWTHNTKFHLEVKATLGPCSEPCFVSQNQLDKMRQYEGDLGNVYILIRVFQLEAEGGPSFRFFLNPWSLYLEGALDFRSNEGYKVYGLV
ncbi:hypothetical protein FOZG_06413 [Fusarium oxysporum Fo47]|uniref:Protein NO VEIN C-terminal domain-containing protein n=1 Tax=Fusarium oxysporum Fo47 TaxID=660027 RepID=W9K9F1_FUSOX|nr:hypothetical protein FOZG_06413 [Fusarium oxysporum Fo47]